MARLIGRSLDYNGTRTHNHLVRKQTLNRLAKLVKWLRVVGSSPAAVTDSYMLTQVSYFFLVATTNRKCIYQG